MTGPTSQTWSMVHGQEKALNTPSDHMPTSSTTYYHDVWCHHRVILTRELCS